MMTDEESNKKFFIIEKENFYNKPTYRIHNRDMYDLTTAVKKLLALDTLNEDKERTSYHLQEVSFSMVAKPLKLTPDMEVKEDKQQELF